MFTIMAQNIKSIKNLLWSPKANQLNLIIGNNGSGKSTLATMLLYTESVRVHGLAAGYGSALGWKDSVVRAGTGRGYWVVEDEGGDWGCSFDAKYGTRVPKVNTLNTRFRVYMNANIDLIRSSEVSHQDTMGPRGEDLTGVLRCLLEYDPDQFNVLKDSLSTAFPDIVSDMWLEHKEDQFYIRHPAGQPLPLRLASASVIQYLFCLVALTVALPGDVVVIDDPTLHLHPFAIQRLSNLAYSYAKIKHFTVIFMTYDVVLLNMMKNELECVHIQRTNGIKSITDLYNIDWLQKMFSLGELYTNGEFGLPYDKDDSQDWMDEQEAPMDALGKKALGDLYLGSGSGNEPV